jgi:hypothetical protein
VEETLGIPEPSELAKDSEVIEMEEVESTQVVEDEPVKVEKADRDEVSELKKVEEDEASGFSVWSGVSALSSAIAHKVMRHSVMARHRMMPLQCLFLEYLQSLYLTIHCYYILIVPLFTYNDLN